MGYNKRGNRWTEEEDNILRELYPFRSCIELSKLVNHSPRGIESHAFSLGLRKDKDWMRNRRSKGWFKEGEPSPNKGKTWNQMFTPEQQAKIRKNLFAPGSRPHNCKPIGHERKAVDGYWLVKVAEPNVFRLKHRLLWEKHYGPIPENVEISFIDGNPDNITIENLRAETHHDKFIRCCCVHTVFPPDIREMIQLKGALKRQINKAENNGKERRNGKTETDEG